MNVDSEGVDSDVHEDTLGTALKFEFEIKVVAITGFGFKVEVAGGAKVGE